MRDAELAYVDQIDQLSQVDSFLMKATPVSAPAPKPEPPKLEPTDEYKKGLDEISKQLVDLADYLPLVKQCMKDVKAGYYTTQVAAHIASNGISDAVVDPLTGKVIRVETKKPEKLGKQSEVVELPAHVLSGESDDGNGEQVYDHGFSPEDKKIRAEDEKILEKVEKKAEGMPKPEKKEDGEGGDKKGGDKKDGDKKDGDKKDGDKKDGDKKEGGDKKDGGDKKGDAKKDAPAGGAKKEEKKEGGAAQTDAKATTEAETKAAADAKPAEAAQADAKAEKPAEEKKLSQTSVWHTSEDYFRFE